MELIVGFLLGLLAHDLCKNIIMNWKRFDDKA